MGHKNGTHAIIIMMLVALLVVETATLGYVVARPTNVPPASSVSTSVQTPTTTKPPFISGEVVDTDSNPESLAGSIIATVKHLDWDPAVVSYTAGAGEDWIANKTYLFGLAESERQKGECFDVYISTDDIDNRNLSKIKDPAAQGGTFKDKLKALGVGTIQGYCKDGETLYLKTVSELLTGTVYSWGLKASTFSLVTRVSGLADGYYDFFPNAFNGYHLVQTGYGDAGHLWWNYYAVFDEGDVLFPLESCADAPVFDDNDQLTTPEKRTRECNFTYVK